MQYYKTKRLKVEIKFIENVVSPKSKEINSSFYTF